VEQQHRSSIFEPPQKIVFGDVPRLLCTGACVCEYGRVVWGYRDVMGKSNIKHTPRLLPSTSASKDTRRVATRLDLAAAFGCGLA